MMTDTIADMLTRIRNANSAGKENVSMPTSKKLVDIAKIMKAEGYIADCRMDVEGAKRTLVIELKYFEGKPVIEGLRRISKPSCRVHCGSREIPRVRNGLGTVVLSTPNGILSGKQAAAQNVGGEILCYVW